MRTLTAFLLVVALPLAVAAQDTVGREKTAPGLSPNLKKPFAGSKAGFVLPDVTRWVAALDEGTARKPERVTRIDVTVTAQEESKLGGSTPNALWRGLLLPEAGAASSKTPVLDLREVRVKVLLFAADGKPLSQPAPGAQVVLKIGAETYPTLSSFSMVIERIPADAPTVLDVNGAVPAGHAVAVLTMLLNAGHVPSIVNVENNGSSSGDLPELLTKLVAKERKNAGAQVAVRVRADARASWRTVQRTLDAVTGAGVQRVTLAANAGKLEIDLFTPGRGPVVVMRREVRPQDYDDKLRRDMAKTPEVGGEVIEKPIIILEEEVETTNNPPEVEGRPLDDKAPVAFGVGGGAAGAYGMRWDKGLLAREGGGPDTEGAVAEALNWLARHQSPDGHWDAAGFTAQCVKGACKGTTPWRAHHVPGDARYNVGVTALALLAYAGNGHTHRFGAHKRAVNKGLTWLKRQVTAEGTIGHTGGETVYNHALATQALCELYAVSRDFTLKRICEQAVAYVLKAQNPGLGWKYGAKSGRNDTVVTGRMVLALKAAKDAGLTVPDAAFEGARAWFERATDAAGTVGYEAPGGGSSFLPRSEGKFDPQPVCTAVATYCRLQMGERSSLDVIRKGSIVLVGKLPEWKKRGKTVHFYYWHAGSLAMFQVGGERWKNWNLAMKAALLPKQSVQGCSKGSWEPVGEWCLAGGRVYATALNALTLETYYRFARGK